MLSILLRSKDSDIRYTIYEKEEEEIIISSHRWVSFGSLQKKCVCGAFFMPGVYLLKVYINEIDSQNAMCLYSMRDHMVMDIIC